MRVFIAGNYNQPHVYAAYRQELVQLGANVNSAWLEMPPFSKIERRAAAERATGLRLEHLNVPADSAHVWPLVEAHEYLQALKIDIDHSDLIIAFGNRWEVGWALARGKVVIVVDAPDQPMAHLELECLSWDRAKAYVRLGLMNARVNPTRYVTD